MESERSQSLTDDSNINFGVIMVVFFDSFLLNHSNFEN